MNGERVLTVRDLSVRLGDAREGSRVIRGVDLDLRAAEVVAIVGESGSGKSLTLRALLGLLPDGVRADGGTISWRTPTSGHALVGPEGIRGRGASMIFQDPIAALNPLMRVGTLLAQAQTRSGRDRKAIREHSLYLLREVGVPEPERRLRAYPHQLSGGLRQRVMIAMALACDPDVLLCDEPTTALDVTVQAQVLALLKRLQTEHQMSLLFVTHDLGVASQIASRVLVMYGGRIVESGPTGVVLRRPQHPYTKGLIASIPGFARSRESLESIPGRPPRPSELDDGCAFRHRCRVAVEACAQEPPVVALTDGHSATCVQVALGQHVAGEAP